MGFVAILFANATPSAAASYTLNFTGTVTGTTGIFTTLGIAGADPVSGSITFDPFNDSSYIGSPPVATSFAQSAASFTFHVNHPGGLDFSNTDAGTGEVQSSNFGVAQQLILFAAGAVSSLDLNFTTLGPGAALSSLAALPTTSGELLSLLGGTAVSYSGLYQIPTYGTVNFAVAFSPAVATTPIPAALPLFGSGLMMLGFVAMKRRAHSRARA